MHKSHSFNVCPVGSSGRGVVNDATNTNTSTGVSELGCSTKNLDYYGNLFKSDRSLPTSIVSTAYSTLINLLNRCIQSYHSAEYHDEYLRVVTSYETVFLSAAAFRWHRFSLQAKTINATTTTKTPPSRFDLADLYAQFVSLLLLILPQHSETIVVPIPKLLFASPPPALLPSSTFSIQNSKALSISEDEFDYEAARLSLALLFRSISGQCLPLLLRGFENALPKPFQPNSSGAPFNTLLTNMLRMIAASSSSPPHFHDNEKARSAMQHFRARFRRPLLSQLLHHVNFLERHVFTQHDREPILTQQQKQQQQQHKHNTDDAIANVTEKDGDEAAVAAIWEKLIAGHNLLLDFLDGELQEKKDADEERDAERASLYSDWSAVLLDTLSLFGLNQHLAARISTRLLSAPERATEKDDVTKNDKVEEKEVADEDTECFALRFIQDVHTRLVKCLPSTSASSTSSSFPSQSRPLKRTRDSITSKTGYSRKMMTQPLQDRLQHDFCCALWTLISALTHLRAVPTQTALALTPLIAQFAHNLVEMRRRSSSSSAAASETSNSCSAGDAVTRSKFFRVAIINASCALFYLVAFHHAAILQHTKTSSQNENDDDNEKEKNEEDGEEEEEEDRVRHFKATMRLREWLSPLRLRELMELECRPLRHFHAPEMMHVLEKMLRLADLDWIQPLVESAQLVQHTNTTARKTTSDLHSQHSFACCIETPFCGESGELLGEQTARRTNAMIRPFELHPEMRTPQI